MTTATLVFDPFSEDFFNGPYETYRRMREEAPVYYNAQYDFYALTRHEDVAAAYKDFETFSSARGVDLSMVRKGEVTEHGSIIVMDPPDHRHMRSLLNKVFTPRAIQSQQPMVSALIDKYLSAVNPDGFDMVQDFSALFPVEVITTMQGVPAEDSQRVRLWIDDLLHRESGEVEMSEAGLKSAIDMAIYYYKLVNARRAELGDDLLSKLITSEIERADGEMAPLSTIEITEFATLLGGAGAETVTKLLGNAAWCSVATPISGRSCSTIAARSRSRSKNCCATRRPPSTTCGARCVRSHFTASRSRPGNPFSWWAVRRIGTRRRGPIRTPSTSTATARRRRIWAWATGFTAAWARRWPVWRVRSRWRRCWTSCPASKWTGAVASG